MRHTLDASLATRKQMTMNTEIAYPSAFNGRLLSADVDVLDALAPNLRLSAGGRCLINANNDIEAVQAFLCRYDDSPNTQIAYTKEVERFLMWCLFVARKGLAELNCDDIKSLLDFYQAPPDEWVANNRARRHSPDWRPFRGPVTGKNLNHSRAVIRSLFDFLLQARYVDGNPVALTRAKPERGRTNGAARSQLTENALAYCMQAINDWGKHGQLTRALRASMIMSFYLHTGARKTELSEISVSDLVQIRQRWWVRVLRKGGKESELPVSSTMMEHLASFRRYHGLPPYPAPNERRPLFSRIHDPDAPISGNMIYRELKTVFRRAANIAQTEGDEAAAIQLLHASTHWLRHTSVGRVVEASRSLKVGQTHGGHASPVTTSGYANFEQDEWHDKITGIVEESIVMSPLGAPKA